MDRALSPDSPGLRTAERFVRAAGIERAVDSLELLGRGVKGVVWRVLLEDQEALALKIYSRAGSVIREHAGYRARAGRELALPSMLGGAAESVDAPDGWTLMTLAPGGPMNSSLTTMSRSEFLGVYRAVGEQLRRMHETSCPSYSLVVGAKNGAGDNVEWFRGRVASSIDGFLASGGNRHLAARIEERLAQFDAELACCERPRFCHGDMHPENIRIAPGPDGVQFVGVIDLEESLAADPAQDLARTLHSCPAPGDDVKAALLEGYGEAPAWLDAVLPAYHLYYELELWNYFASGGSRRPLASIARRMAAQSGASKLRIWRSGLRSVISPAS